MVFVVQKGKVEITFVAHVYEGALYVLISKTY